VCQTGAAGPTVMKLIIRVNSRNIINILYRQCECECGTYFACPPALLDVCPCNAAMEGSGTHRNIHIETDERDTKVGQRSDIVAQWLG